MHHPGAFGVCKEMQEYKPCMNHGPCADDYKPKCQPANAAAFCDINNNLHRCECYFPGGAWVEADSEGEIVKTPTTTE